MKKTGYLFCGLAASALLAQTAFAVDLSVDQITVVSADGDVNGVGTNSTGLIGTTEDIYVRERRQVGQIDRRLGTFVSWDLSALDSAFVNDVNFSATLTLDYVERLNDLNSASVDAIAFGSAWADSSGSFPLYDDVDQQAGGFTVLGNVATLDPTLASNEIVLDLTTIVQSWVNTPSSNNGLAFYIPILEAQAASFDIVNFSAVVPEPSTYALFGGLLALTAVAIRRRK